LRLFERGTSEFRNFGEASLENQEIFHKKRKEMSKTPGLSSKQYPNRTLLPFLF